MKWVVAQYLPVLTAFCLSLRAAISDDSRFRKTSGVALGFLPLLLWALSEIATSPQSISASQRWMTAGALMELIASAYLIAWAIKTSDPIWQRAGFTLAGLFLALDVIGLWRFLALQRTETTEYYMSSPVPKGAD